MENSTVAVVIPAYYKPQFSSDELISLRHLKKFLKSYDKFFVVPHKTLNKINKDKDFNYLSFSNKYFFNTKTYNKLLLQEEFYNKFTKYKYILIYQLDALVFSDRLQSWCNKGYDYIAAPWFNSKIAWLTNKKGSPPSGGNGGFSLRKVSSFLKVLKIVKNQANRTSDNIFIQKSWLIKAILTGKSHNIWLNAPADNYPFNEDGFWSLEAPKYLNIFKVAPFKEAVKFAFERFPKKCFKLNHYKIPFGCHAWTKYDRAFWLPYILKG